MPKDKSVFSGGRHSATEIRTASPVRLWQILKETTPEGLEHAIFNPNFNEEMAIFVASLKQVQAETLGALAADQRFRSSYKLKLALAKNPHTPRRVAISLLRFLKIFDLADLTKDHRLHISIRQKIEQMLAEKIPALPSGIKSAMAKRASSNVVIAIMERGDANVIATCLQSPLLTEADLYKLINKSSSRPALIKAIANHPKWSLRYDIRFALIRNPHCPMVNAAEFIKTMKTTDLKYLFMDPNLPRVSRPFIYRELVERGASIENEEEETYAITEEQEDEE